MVIGLKKMLGSSNDQAEARADQGNTLETLENEIKQVDS
jgi:hypothetical protein